MRKYLFCVVACLFIYISCEDEDQITELTNRIQFSNFSSIENYKYAVVSTQIKNLNNVEIIQHGHCWSENQNPTIADDKTEFGIPESNVFTSELNNLDHNTNYYVRAYAEFQDMIYYGDSTFMFKTNEILAPSLYTVKINRVCLENVEIKCLIENTNGGEILSQGVCWNTSGSPTANDNSTNSEIGNLNYTGFMQNLVIGGKYYLRAYAVNEGGVGYGDELMLNFNWGVIQVQDYDGNWYNTVKIGDQIWLKENLKTTHYPNGDQIENGDGIDINSESTPTYYFNYNDNEANAEIYGRLYTWYAATNACPDGWHMPINEDWSKLFNHIGSENVARLKSSGTIEDGTGLWYSPNTLGTDEFGFSLLPSGFYSAQFYSYSSLGESAWFVYADDGTYGWVIYHDSIEISDLGTGLKFGHPVRCIKNE